MQKYFNSVTNSRGDAILGARVTVTKESGALATIYSDNGVTVQANPMLTDGNGYFAFYAADGRYDLRITAVGIKPIVLDDILLEDIGDQLTDFEERVYPGVYDAPPTTRPSGAACVEGDRCTILVGGAGFEHLRSGGIWLVPNIDATTLAQSTGAARVGILLDKAGGVPTTVERTLAETISVFRFATDAEIAAIKAGTPGRDDSALIRRAVEAAAGGCVWLEPYEYLWDGSFLGVKTKTALFGYGATLKLKPGNYTSHIWFMGTAQDITYDALKPSYEDVYVFGLTFDGNVANVTATGSCTALSAYKTTRFVARDVQFKNLPGVTGQGYGIIFSMCNESHLSYAKSGRTDRSNVYVWESHVTIDGALLEGSYYRDCITAGSNVPSPQYQASYLKLSNTKMLTNFPTATHALRLSGHVTCEAVDLDITGYIANNGGGQDAAATATVAGGVVTGLTVTNQGAGYVSPPEVLIFGGGGRLGTATAVLTADKVTSYTITDGGSGYTTVPAVRVGTGSDGIYVVGTIPIKLVATNLRVNGAYWGVSAETDVEHNIELIAPQIGLITPCAKGVWVNSSQATLKLNGGTVKASVQPLYNNSDKDWSVIGTDLVGGTIHNFLRTNAAAVQRFIGVVVRGNTAPSYSALFTGAGEPIIVGSKAIGNTNNVLRCLPSAVQSGNFGLVVDGVARSGGIVKRSTTANRPAFTSADIGSLFMDTSLLPAGNGKPLFWGNATFVDALGWDVSTPRPTLSASAADLPTALALVNQIRAALIAYGMAI